MRQSGFRLAKVSLGTNQIVNGAIAVYKISPSSRRATGKVYQRLTTEFRKLALAMTRKQNGIITTYER